MPTDSLLLQTGGFARPSHPRGMASGGTSCHQCNRSFKESANLLACCLRKLSRAIFTCEAMSKVQIAAQVLPQDLMKEKRPGG